VAVCQCVFCPRKSIVIDCPYRYGRECRSQGRKEEEGRRRRKSVSEEELKACFERYA
jgi:hypothetical protein